VDHKNNPRPLQSIDVRHTLRGMKSAIIVALIFLAETAAVANPYLPKPGEKTLSMRISTCAVSGGFVHLYTALDYGLFDKYAIKLENISSAAVRRTSRRSLATKFSSPTAPPTRSFPEWRPVSKPRSSPRP
jgi:hypothetical protein